MIYIFYSGFLEVNCEMLINLDLMDIDVFVYIQEGLEKVLGKFERRLIYI